MKAMDQESVRRYSRQLIMPDIGVVGQLKLQEAKVLIVGAGGLGCPALQYLVGAGVGRIGIVDYDEVETSNLHRQVLHTESGAAGGMSKAQSAALFARNLNSKVQVDAIVEQLSSSNAQRLISSYDVVLDASDNAATRYLVNDVCVLTNKPLVSGSALGWEGQLTVYHYKPNKKDLGLCYRCMYPKPPPAAAVTNCSMGGVLGPVPGIIGTMQALETIKLLVGMVPSCHQKMLLFDGKDFSFVHCRLQKRNRECVACGDEPQLALDRLPDYELWCGASATDKCATLHILNREERVSAHDYQQAMDKPHILIDVRQPVELQICAFSNALNIPIGSLEHLSCKYTVHKRMPLDDQNPRFAALSRAVRASAEGGVDIFVVCKQGNDSQKAVRVLKDLVHFDRPVTIRDIQGGIYSWSRHVDNSFALY